MIAQVASRSPERVQVLGVPVDLLDRDGIIGWMTRALADPWDGHCRHVVTLNPEYVMAARRDTAFNMAIEEADLVVADGVGVALAGRLLSGRSGQPARMTGVDLTEWLAGAGEHLFLVGAAPSVAATAREALVRRFPAARIAGLWTDGSPRPSHDGATRGAIQGSGARAVLVAYGAPGQVTWIARNRAALAAGGVRMAIGVGGTFDYLAGTVPRAPRWMQRFGLEWLYRLAREPRRWRRQLALPRFAGLVWVGWLWRRGNRARRLVKTMAPARQRPETTPPCASAAPPATPPTSISDERSPTHQTKSS